MVSGDIPRIQAHTHTYVRAPAVRLAQLLRDRVEIAPRTLVRVRGRGGGRGRGRVRVGVRV